MRPLTIVLVSLVAALAIVVLLLLATRRRARPCFRCGVLATDEYMGFHYCRMCSIVVARMFPAVRHDPPYGFPGGPGYLEFPEATSSIEGKKKEI